MTIERFAPHPDLSWRVVEGEVVILRLKSLSYYSLEPVGSFIWAQMEEGPKSREELIAAITAEFEVDPETAGQDLDSLLKDLRQEELLQVQGEER